MITAVSQQQANGAYDTPEPVARTLVRWVVRHADDRLLDPSCGDGRFLEHHANSVGVEFDPVAATGRSPAPHDPPRNQQQCLESLENGLHSDAGTLLQPREQLEPRHDRRRTT